MNDLTNNQYLKGRDHDFRNYALTDFLYKEIAVERKTNVNDVMIAVYDILALLGFNIHMFGYKFLAQLSARYIIKHDYDKEREIAAIADVYGASCEYINGCINACIMADPDFLSIASKISDISSEVKIDNDIQSAVEIIGAIFKIFYNYHVDEKSLEFDSQFAVNYNRL